MKNLTLIVGSAPDAVEVESWDKSSFTNIVAINNAAKLDIGWTHHIQPEDFPPENNPQKIAASQKIITADAYILILNQYGGCLYQGATMAYTAAYWALGALKPDALLFKACDMVYTQNGETHFYGTGSADPLRDDITLQSLPAKANRLRHFAAEQNCMCLNLSELPNSALTFPRVKLESLESVAGAQKATSNDKAEAAQTLEKQLGYYVESGRYWEHLEKFSAEEITKIDALWETAYERR